MRESPRCPACKQETLRPIIYGFVTDPEMQERADRSEVVLGGCVIEEDSPKWECSKCRERWKDQEVG